MRRTPSPRSRILDRLRLWRTRGDRCREGARGPEPAPVRHPGGAVRHFAAKGKSAAGGRHARAYAGP
eukprot:12611298-Alexandrium_andersonii.AAC.1